MDIIENFLLLTEKTVEILQTTLRLKNAHRKNVSLYQMNLKVFLYNIALSPQLLCAAVFTKMKGDISLLRKNKRFLLVLFQLLSVASIGRKLLNITHTEERIASIQIQLGS